MQPGPNPDNYPPIDPSEPIPDDPGELLPDTPETRALTVPQRDQVPLPPAHSIDCDDPPTIDSEADTILPDDRVVPILGELFATKANAKGGGIIGRYGGD